MTDNIVNFRKAKKKVARAKKESQATENRVKFGRKKSDKKIDLALNKNAKSHIDAHKLDKDSAPT